MIHLSLNPAASRPRAARAPAIGRGAALLLLQIALLALLVIAAGCRDHDSTNVEAPNAPKPVTPPTANAVPADSIRLKSDTAPYTYVVAPGGHIRIVDANTGKVVVTATAPPNALVSVDEGMGVKVANTVVKSGPLPPGHKYELWLDRK